MIYQNTSTDIPGIQVSTPVISNSVLTVEQTVYSLHMSDYILAAAVIIRSSSTCRSVMLGRLSGL